MRRWAFLLRPQWLALYVVVLAFAYLCFTVLAPWQLGKNTKTTRENDQIARSLDADPVPVTSVLPQQDSAAPEEQWQRVTATGRYLPESQVLARLRLIDGDAAFEVLVPFAVDGGPTVLVDRGYVRPVEGSRVPPLDALPTETVTITARLRDSEGLARDKAPFEADGVRQVYSINTEQISAVTGVPLTGSYLQLVDGQPGGLGVIPLPISTRARSCPTASSGSRSASSPRSGSVTSSTRSSRSDAGRKRWPTHRRSAPATSPSR